MITECRVNGKTDRTNYCQKHKTFFNHDDNDVDFWTLMKKKKTKISFNFDFHVMKNYRRVVKLHYVTTFK